MNGDGLQGLEEVVGCSQNAFQKAFEPEALDRRKPMTSEEMTRELAKVQLEYENALKRIEELERQVIMDSLTHTYSRQFFLDEIARQIGIAKRRAHQGDHYNFCVAMVDLDHFKGVNDRYGHKAGDEVLSRVARKLLSGVRRNDIVARYGGEEFGIVLPEVDLEMAIQILERGRENIAALGFRFRTIKEPHDLEQVRVTASFGVVPYCSGMGVDELVHDADSLLYRSKDEGRNRISYRKAN